LTSDLPPGPHITREQLGLVVNTLIAAESPQSRGHEEFA
jgi:hypothetical protein